MPSTKSNQKGEAPPLSPMDIPDGPTEGKASEFPSVAEAPKPEPDVSQGTFKRPKMGEIVLYNHRTINQQGGSQTYVTVPVIITYVYPDGETCDGVLFNTQNSTGQVGAASIYGIRPGDGEARWRRE